MLGIEARSELYMRVDSSGTENRDFAGKNGFHWFHGSIVDFSKFLGPVAPFKSKGPWDR